ncbi:MAG: hypothetical protein JWQ29_2481 [Phenylobacterium sp.]|nr:hypothetical protein [Phenylobacterium sp.]
MAAARQGACRIWGFEMKIRGFAVAAALALSLGAGSAGANVLGNIVTATFQAYGTALNPGESLITSFEGGPGLANTTFYQPGWSLTGNGLLYNTWDGGGAPPAFSASTRDTTQYLSIKGGQSVTLYTPNISEISFYVGSIDSYNHLKIHYFDGTVDPLSGDLSGGWIEDNTIATVGGNQYTGVTNGRLTFTFDKRVASIDLFSDTNSFELSSIGAVVPEPATWSMMIMGFGGIGALIRRRRAPTAFA